MLPIALVFFMFFNQWFTFEVNMLGISRAEGYKFVKSPECPFLVLRIGRRLIIPANSFFNWYESLAHDPIAENEDAAE